VSFTLWETYNIVGHIYTIQENQGFLQICNERSSSSSIHKKSLSRFSGSSGVKDLASSPVLKQVKNKVQHEKYVNQLRFRDLRRRAASIRANKSVAGEGKGIRKTDVVKAAKVALVSEARDAINKLNFSNPKSISWATLVVLTRTMTLELKVKVHRFFSS